MNDVESHQPLDIWKSARGYEAYMGRWSRIVARDFLAWLDVPPGRRWLDVGCGTGELCRAIFESDCSAQVNGVDPSVTFVDYARQQTNDPKARFDVGDARQLPADIGPVDAVVSGLVLNFVPAADRTAAVAEMGRAIRGDGVVAAYVWDYGEGMQLMSAFWDAATALDPAAKEHDEGRRLPLMSRPEPLAGLFRDAGLRDVDVHAIEIATEFADFDDYWQPFLAGQGSAPAYAMSVRDESRAALRDRLRSHVPIAADGSIALTARAWAVRGFPGNG